MRGVTSAPCPLMGTLVDGVADKAGACSLEWKTASRVLVGNWCKVRLDLLSWAMAKTVAPVGSSAMTLAIAARSLSPLVTKRWSAQETTTYLVKSLVEIILVVHGCMLQGSMLCFTIIPRRRGKVPLFTFPTREAFGISIYRKGGTNPIPVPEPVFIY